MIKVKKDNNKLRLNTFLFWQILHPIKLSSNSSRDSSSQRKPAHNSCQVSKDSYDLPSLQQPCDPVLESVNGNTVRLPTRIKKRQIYSETGGRCEGELVIEKLWKR